MDDDDDSWIEGYCDCWTFPEIEFKRRVKVENKYCWLYAQKGREALKITVDRCPTCYTKCDKDLEKAAHQQVLLIEDLFKAHTKLQDNELGMQYRLAMRMWELAQRQNLLTNTVPCIKPYPEVVSGPAEKQNIFGFKRKLKALNFSNCRISNSLIKIKDALVELKSRIDILDQTVDSVFILGNHKHPSIAHVHEVIGDLYEYFYSVLCKLNSWAQLIEIKNVACLEDYMNFITSPHDFLGSIEECTCFIPQLRDCLGGQRQSDCHHKKIEFVKETKIHGHL